MDYDIGQQNNIAWDYADQVEKMEKRLRRSDKRKHQMKVKKRSCEGY